MSTSTPTAPPAPVAAMLSPILWQMNKPDRFDMYSVGIMLIQMCFPNLRRDNQLAAFNRQLERVDYNIIAWRDRIASKRSEYATGAAILSLDGGPRMGSSAVPDRSAVEQARQRLGSSLTPLRHWKGPAFLSSLRRRRCLSPCRSRASGSRSGWRERRASGGCRKLATSFWRINN